MSFPFRILCMALALLAAPLRAQVPQLLNYQGRIVVGTTNFNGTGQFKFALVNGTGTATYWSNDGTSVNGSEPGTAVSLAVTNGLYSVLLGNATLPNMTVLPAAVFTNSDVRLRVWFNDGTNGFRKLDPDQRIAAVGYAMMSSDVVDGAITAAKLGLGAVTGEKLAPGAVGTSQLALGAVTNAQLGPNAVQAGNIANGAIGTAALQLNAVTLDRLATSQKPLLLRSIPNVTPAQDDNFSVATAAVGADKILIGAPQDMGRGSAYLFDLNGTLLRAFNNPMAAVGDRFGSGVVAVGPDKLLIGAPGQDTGATDAGSAYLFALDGTLLHAFNNPNPTTSKFFGARMAAVGVDKILIGVPQSDDGGLDDSGKAYVFNVDGALLQTFNNPSPAGNDSFGYSVAALGADKVLISAPSDDTGANDAGSAYLFALDGTLLRGFNNPAPAQGDSFGLAVGALGTDKALISAVYDDTGAVESGTAYMFDLNGTLLRTFNNPSPGFFDLFGFPVTGVGSDRVLIGASGDSTNAQYSGAAYLYDLNGNLLRVFENPTRTQLEAFATTAIPVGADKVLFGAYMDAVGGTAYLFDLNRTTSEVAGLTAESVAAGAVATEGLRYGAVTRDKIAGGAISGDKIATNAITAEKLDSTFSADIALRSGGNAFNGTQTIGSGNFGIGTLAPVTPLEMVFNSGTKNLQIRSDSGLVPGINITGTGGNLGIMRLRNAMQIWPSDDGTRASRLDLRNTAGAATISLDGSTGRITANGSGLSSLNASNIASGTLGDARLSSNVALQNGANSFSNAGNSFTGNGAGLTTLNATNVTSGVLADSLLSANVARRNATNAFTGAQSISGNLAIGTVTAGERVEIVGSDATVRIKNSNDAIGGWLGDSFGALQLGMYNPTATATGVVPANTKRSFFAMDGTTGKVGSVTNNFGDPAFRVELDDGSGSLRLNTGGNIHLTDRPLTSPQAAGRIFFPATAGQYINVGTSGFGYQNAIVVGGPGEGFYHRSSGDFFWYDGGSHHANPGDPGSGGTFLMNLDGTGLGIGRFPAANKLEVEGNASKSSAGSWLANSDARIKIDIRPVARALDTLAQVRPVRFRYSQEYLRAHPAIEDREYLNVIAQQFREVFPEWVKDSGEKLTSGAPILQVDTYPLTIFSVSAIQELRAENERLQKQNALLMQRLDRVEKVVETLSP